MTLAKYRKAAVAVAGAILTVAAQALPDNQYVIAAVAVATAVGVWRVPNKTSSGKATVILENKDPHFPTGKLLMPGGDFYTIPQEEVCQVGSEICTRIPGIRIYCKTEGRSALACPDCLKVWRQRVQTEPFRLSLRCPLCADWARPISPIPTPTPTRSALQGDIAQSIDRAMHAEGLLQDIREKVLQRLAKDAPWLDESTVIR